MLTFAFAFAFASQFSRTRITGVCVHLHLCPGLRSVCSGLCRRVLGMLGRPARPVSHSRDGTEWIRACGKQWRPAMRGGLLFGPQPAKRSPYFINVGECKYIARRLRQPGLARGAELCVVFRAIPRAGRRLAVCGVRLAATETFAAFCNSMQHADVRQEQGCMRLRQIATAGPNTHFRIRLDCSAVLRAGHRPEELPDPSSRTRPQRRRSFLRESVIATHRTPASLQACVSQWQRVFAVVLELPRHAYRRRYLPPWPCCRATSVIASAGTGRRHRPHRGLSGYRASSTAAAPMRGRPCDKATARR